MATAATRVKRLLVGRALASAKLEHQLLPKSLALPVFSSDPLSSVAYATEEMMLVLLLAGAAALSLMVPVAAVIAVVLLIVVTSYRQTVRAYPRGGGSYIVARENLGTIPGLTAASAILTGYVVTASVSVTAGAVAVTSALPGLLPYKVPIAIGFIVVIALANLRGAKESGIVFAVPTYGFVATIYVLLLFGLVECLDGCPKAATADLHLEPQMALTAFLILRAFTSGSAALTGVEAIADGVQAFRRPQARNAATTLGIMAVMSITMFLGITILADAFDVKVSDELVSAKSVLAQVGETAFGRGPMFFVLQLFTAAILVVAANTAYQDFPRLSAILARDRFLPGQFKNRGDRLVFSNGIIVLSVVAGLLVWMFRGELTRLIALYLVGVFTAFTFSQAGMVRRWIRLKEHRWRWNAFINGIGATTTGVVLLVVVLTKFREGAWMIIVALPIMVALLLGVYRHYNRVHSQLRARHLTLDMEPENTVIVLVADLGPATAEAVSWLRAIRPERVLPLYIGDASVAEVESKWADMAPRLGSLHRLELSNGRLVRTLRRYVRDLPRGTDDFVTVVVPETIRRKSVLSNLWNWDAFRIKASLLFERGIVVVDIPLLPEERAEAEAHAHRPLEPERNVCIVPVSAAHDVTVRALAYARTLGPAKLEAVFFAGEPEEAEEILQEWASRRLDVPLSIIEAPFRDIGPPLLSEIRRYTSREDTVATVVLPEFVPRKWWQHFLHNQTALFMKRLLLFEPDVVAVSVPTHLD
ncbi:MAG: APC family permease [Actinomycetota bacterium]